MNRDISTLLKELETLCSPMSMFDAEADRDAEDRKWVRSLSEVEIETIGDWLEGDSEAYLDAAKIPDSSWCRMVQTGSRFYGEAARLRGQPSLLPRLTRMFLNPRSIGCAIDIAEAWRSPEVVPLLRQAAETADDWRVERIAVSLVEIRHPEAIALLESIAKRHEGNYWLHLAIRLAIAENASPQDS